MCTESSSFFYFLVFMFLFEGLRATKCQSHLTYKVLGSLDVWKTCGIKIQIFNKQNDKALIFYQETEIQYIDCELQYSNCWALKQQCTETLQYDFLQLV